MSHIKDHPDKFYDDTFFNRALFIFAKIKSSNKSIITNQTKMFQEILSARNKNYKEEQDLKNKGFKIV